MDFFELLLTESKKQLNWRTNFGGKATKFPSLLFWGLFFLIKYSFRLFSHPDTYALPLTIQQSHATGT